MPNPRAVEAAPDGYAAFALPAAFGEYLPMVELVLKTGKRVALPYPWLAAEFDPADGISLAFTTGAAVAIRGRNMAGLFSALVRHQAVCVREADRAVAELAPDAAALVEAITVVSARDR